MRHILPFLLAISLFGGCSHSAKPTLPAPPIAPPDESISIDFQDENLALIITKVAEFFRLDVRLPPGGLEGVTSIRLRDVTWQQIFKVMLSPAGYDFYERGGVVHILTRTELDALPSDTSTVVLHHKTPDEMARYLAKLYPTANFLGTAIPGELSYRAHPKYTERIAAEIARSDSPDKNLNPFPNPVFFPATIHELPLPPNRVFYVNGVPGPGEDPFSTHVHILKHVSATAVADYLGDKEHIKPPSRALPDIRINALIVTAPASRLPRMEAIVRYLDDPRWYEPPAPPPVAQTVPAD